MVLVFLVSLKSLVIVGIGFKYCVGLPTQALDRRTFSSSAIAFLSGLFLFVPGPGVPQSAWWVSIGLLVTAVTFTALAIVSHRRANGPPANGFIAQFLTYLVFTAGLVVGFWSWILTLGFS